MCSVSLGATSRLFVPWGAPPFLGQVVEAMVVPNDESAPPLASLRGHVKAAHPAFMAPKPFTLVDAIPRTALGKPIRR